MAINIKNPEVEAKIKRLAALTGDTLTGAVDDAVSEKLKVAEPRRDWDAIHKTLQEIWEITKHDPLPSPEEINDEFYDEDGFPK